MDLTHWISELEEEGIPIPWFISHNSVPDFSYNQLDWAQFLSKAADTIFENNISLNIFYAWHDEQSFQLRFNAICGSKDELPFKAEYQIVDSPKLFLSEWLKKPNYIDISDLIDIDNDDIEGETNILRVWVKVRNEEGL